MKIAAAIESKCRADSQEKVNQIMRISVNGWKKLAIALITLPLVGIGYFNSPTPTIAAVQEFEAAAVYKAKCAMCHGPKVEKNFDAAKADELLIETVLKGVKPKMPGYELKGLDADKAKALIAHMKQTKTAPAE
jgi:cytochrome c5